VGVAALLALIARGATAQEATCDAEAWRAVVVAHAARHPALAMQDLYKLLHHGVFGSEHAVDDLEGARAWLEDEIGRLRGEAPSRAPEAGSAPDVGSGRASAGAREAEPEVEPVAPGGRIVRVHLRPFLARGGDPEALLAAFVTTANRRTGSREAFLCAATAAGATGVGSWSPAEWERFVADRARVGFPAIQHSAAFEAAYGPAYRVIAADLIARLAR
jgi:hypothetical protein